jgi:hypothetical protein
MFILVKVIDGKVTYLQFLEDSYATSNRPTPDDRVRHLCGWAGRNQA